jgi:energy-coupling factor transporter ATP-binding protein EcfA2
MSLEQEMVTWAAERPAWQQRALRQIATGTSAPVAASIAAELVAGTVPAAVALTVAELPGGTTSGASVRLRFVKPLAHVNALLDEECLTFSASGINVVYGDNASGKSGYARLLKQVVRARVREDVLTDVFQDHSDKQPSALIGYEVDGTPYEDIWPDFTNPLLGQISFYDDVCGEAYITHDSVVSYRPSMLVHFDRLIELCDDVRRELDQILAQNTQNRVTLPAVAEGSGTHTFLAELSATTTIEMVDSALEIPADVDDQITTLADEEARLRATDPARERKRLNDVATSFTTVQRHLTMLHSKLGVAAFHQIGESRRKAADHRAAAVLASSGSFETEPLGGVGSDTWRAMWDAARQYAETEAYRDREFPSTGPDDRCILCQQALSPEAASRLHRFHGFMTNTTERQAAESQRTLEAALGEVGKIDPEPAQVAVALAAMEGSDSGLAERCRNAVETFKIRKTAVLRLEGEDGIEPPSPPDSLSDALQTASEQAVTSANTIVNSGFQEAIAELAARRTGLEARRTVNAARADIVAEIARLAERRKITAARDQTDTGGITRKSTEMARDHVTKVILDRFTRESHDLKLERVTLNHPGGRKGQLMQRPALLAARQQADIPAVLSEGEQTALGLAGFLTEAYFDESKSAIVLDDPVTSLDHIRRSHVAARLCQFAQDRQVTVFTHDLTFVSDLRKAAEELEVIFTERAVERHGNGSIGVCREQHPWKAKDAKSRLAQLGTELDRIKKEMALWDGAMYEREVAEWAGRLSETWERIISMDIANQLVDKGTSEVRPKMMRVLARITDQDEKEFQSSYGRCSKWLRRHDKSTDTNYVAPDVVDLESELKLVETWHDRVRKYGV